MTRKKKSYWTKSRPLSVTAFVKWLRAYVKRTSRVKLVFLGILVVFVMYVLGYYLVVRPIQEYNQKKEFDKAEAEITALANRIQEKIGKADGIETEQSCGYASQKYSKGPRSCSVGVSVLYENRNVEQSSDLMLSAASLVGGAPLQEFGIQTSAFRANEERRVNQQISQSYGETNLICNVRYIHPVHSEISSPFNPSSKENLQITISCSGPSLKEFYPLRD